METKLKVKNYLVTGGALSSPVIGKLDKLDPSNLSGVIFWLS